MTEENQVRKDVEKFVREICDSGTPIAKAWEGFSREQLSKTFPDGNITVEGLRALFFHGAAFLFDMIVLMQDETDEVTADDQRRMDIVAGEIEQFKEKTYNNRGMKQ